jgi:hypothetical protein
MRSKNKSLIRIKGRSFRRVVAKKRRCGFTLSKVFLFLLIFVVFGIILGANTGQETQDFRLRGSNSIHAVVESHTIEGPSVSDPSIVDVSNILENQQSRTPEHLPISNVLAQPKEESQQQQLEKLQSQLWQQQQPRMQQQQQQRQQQQQQQQQQQLQLQLQLQQQQQQNAFKTSIPLNMVPKHSQPPDSQEQPRLEKLQSQVWQQQQQPALTIQQYQQVKEREVQQPSQQDSVAQQFPQVEEHHQPLHKFTAAHVVDALGGMENPAVVILHHNRRGGW